MNLESAGLDQLLTPFSLSSLRLPNRFVMAPMTRNQSPDGLPTSENADYYLARARGGMGLIITEGTYIGRDDAGPSTTVPRMTESAADGWRAVVDSVHRAGSAIVPQLWHYGGARGSEPDYSPDVASVSPSGLDLFGNPVGRTLTVDDLDEIVAAYADAARMAQQIGFDGVELHGAHGYLLDQFFWAATNHRTDQYGGPSPAERAQFPVRVVQAVRRAVGPDFTVIFRFSQWKVQHYTARIVANPTELEQLLEPLAAAGVDIFHCSTRRHWEPAFPDQGQLSLAGWTRSITGRPVITVGSVGVDTEFHSEGAKHALPVARRLQILTEQFERGEFDLVAVGRAVLADAAWLHKVRTGGHDTIHPYRRQPS